MKPKLVLWNKMDKSLARLTKKEDRRLKLLMSERKEEALLLTLQKEK